MTLRHIGEVAGDAAARLKHFIATGDPGFTPESIAAASEKAKEHDARRAKQRLADDLQRARNLSEIGPLFAERTFETFRPSMLNNDAYRAALDCAAGAPDAGLGIYGGLGNGKSRLAGAIVNNCIERGIPAAFTTTIALLSRLQAANKRGSAEDEDVLIAHYAEIPVLVLDDLGKERLTEWGAKTLFAIINARYERKRKLIVTANASAGTLLTTKYARLHELRGNEGIDDALGPAILDRIREMSAPWVENKAPGERGKA
jgi:DNA replication protein DnaC